MRVAEWRGRTSGKGREGGKGGVATDGSKRDANLHFPFNLARVKARMINNLCPWNMRASGGRSRRARTGRELGKGGEIPRVVLRVVGLECC